MPGAFAYLTAHGALDVEHVKLFEDLVNSIKNSKFQNLIVMSAKDFYILFGNMFRTLGYELMFKPTHEKRAGS